MLTDYAKAPTPVRHQQRFTGQPRALREVRRFVATCLQGYPAADDIVLAADELAGNAVQYSLARRPGPTGGFAVTLDITPGLGVHLSLDDPGPAPTTTTQPRPDEEHGRGRDIVTALASGDDTTPEGHRAWADFGWPNPNLTSSAQAPASPSPRRRSA